MFRAKSIADALTTALMATAAIAIIVLVVRVESRPNRPTWVSLPLPTKTVSLDRAVLRGSSAAGLAVVVYSDFQCPFCRRLALDTLPQFESDYVDRGRVQLGFQAFPLVNVHEFAERTTQAARCADQQHRFWQMHDLLFADPEHVDDASLLARASRIGMDTTEFTDCLARPASDAVRDDIAAGVTVGIRGTPTVFIGNVLPSGLLNVTDALTGAIPYTDLASIVDRRLKEAIRH